LRVVPWLQSGASSPCLSDAFGVQVRALRHILRNLILGALGLYDHTPLLLYRLLAFDCIGALAVVDYKGKGYFSNFLEDASQVVN